MSYFHPDMHRNPSRFHPALIQHHQEAQHRLVSDPVNVAPGGPVDPLTFHQGPTIPDPVVFNLFAGTFWDDPAFVDGFTGRIVENGYLSAAEGQGTKPGRFGGSFRIPAPASAQITDADCRTMLAAAIGQNGIPASDPNHLYLLFLPDGVQVFFDSTHQDGSCTGFCGYHSSGHLGGTPLYYAVHPATTCSGCFQTSPRIGLQMVIGHEIVEACTDPEGTGWFNDTTGSENADECAWVQDRYGDEISQGYAAQNAQGQWVNSIGLYVPTAAKKAATKTYLVVSTKQPVSVGQDVQVNATVTSTDSNALTGSVSLTGAAGVGGTSGLVQGAATFHTQPTAAGSFSLVGAYGGDDGHDGSTSEPVPLIVQAAQGGGFQSDPLLVRLYNWERDAAAYIAAQYALNTTAGAAEALKYQTMITQTVIAFWPYVHGLQTQGEAATFLPTRLPSIPAAS